MKNISVNPNLKIVRFDGSPDNCEEIKKVFNAEIEKVKKFYSLKRKCKVHPADAAAGWTGGMLSLKLEVGHFITENDGVLHILTPKEFDRFFVII